MLTTITRCARTLALATLPFWLAACPEGGGGVPVAVPPGGGPGSVTIGGTLSNLGAGETVVLQNNAGDNLSLTASGSFTFATALPSGSAYAVTVLTQPAGNVCSITNSSGTANTPVTNVTVSCNGQLMGGAIQGNSLTLTNAVTTLAGTYSAANGTGSAANFNTPSAIEKLATDGTNLYVADSNNHIIRKIVIATGIVSTLAGSPGIPGIADGPGTAAQFNSPSGLTTDGTNLYVADSNNNTIRQIGIATGAVTTLAGAGGVPGSTDGSGINARFNGPKGLATDGTNLYVADTNNQTIRQIVIATSAVTTLAGTVGTTGSTDGPGAVARFRFPFGLTTDGTNLYVADSNNHTIRQLVLATNMVTTIAGTALSSGSADGIGAAAQFNVPGGLTTDGTNLYVPDTRNHTIRQVLLATGAVTTIAGSATVVGSTDGAGSVARFNFPSGIVHNGTGLYILDSNNLTIRKLALSGNTVSTFASIAASSNGTGAAARFFNPSQVTTDGTNLYVADAFNHTIRQVVIATGVVTTLAGSPGVRASADGIGAAAQFANPNGLSTDGTNLYVADTGNHTIRQIVLATGAVTTLAGSPGVSGSADGIGAAARFFFPGGLTTDGINLYVTENNHTIRQIVIATGVVTTLAGSPGVSGSADGIGAAAQFFSPRGLTTDGTNLYVADSGNHTIRQVVIATGAVTTLAGSAGVSGSADGTGSAARFSAPWGATTDGANLYVAERSNHTIRKIVLATGTVTTLAGSPGLVGGLDGNGNTARFRGPQGLTTDGAKLFISDTGGFTIRAMQ